MKMLFPAQQEPDSSWANQDQGTRSRCLAGCGCDCQREAGFWLLDSLELPIQQQLMNPTVCGGAKHESSPFCWASAASGEHRLASSVLQRGIKTSPLSRIRAEEPPTFGSVHHTPPELLHRLKWILTFKKLFSFFGFLKHPAAFGGCAAARTQPGISWRSARVNPDPAHKREWLWGGSHGTASKLVGDYRCHSNYFWE